MRTWLIRGGRGEGGDQGGAVNVVYCAADYNKRQDLGGYMLLASADLLKLAG